MFLRIDIIHNEAWVELDAAVNTHSEAPHPFRLMTLATIDDQLKPQARTVVLRDLDFNAQSLEFHTDIRSPKWNVLSARPDAQILFYDPEKKLQLRFDGQVQIFGPDSPESQAAWDKLSPFTKSTYSNQAPGVVVSELGRIAKSTQSEVPSDEDLAEGRANFGVCVFKAQNLDWCRLSRGENHRAVFDYSKSGVQSSDWLGMWVAP